METSRGGCDVDIRWRRVAAAATWIFRGDGSRRLRRGYSIETGARLRYEVVAPDAAALAAATDNLLEADAAALGAEIADAALARNRTNAFADLVVVAFAVDTRPPTSPACAGTKDGSRRRRGYSLASTPRLQRVASTPRLQRGWFVSRDAFASMFPRDRPADWLVTTQFAADYGVAFAFADGDALGDADGAALARADVRAVGQSVAAALARAVAVADDGGAHRTAHGRADCRAYCRADR